MNQENKKFNTQAEWKKALTSFKEGQVLLKENLIEGAMSRFYYAAFHAAQALLFSKGLEAKSHKGVGRLFSLHFVKSGQIDSHYSRILSHSQQDREEADYFSEYTFSREDGYEREKDTQKFLDVIEKVLKQDKLL